MERSGAAGEGRHADPSPSPEAKRTGFYCGGEGIFVLNKSARRVLFMPGHQVCTTKILSNVRILTYDNTLRSNPRITIRCTGDRFAVTEITTFGS